MTSGPPPEPILTTSTCTHDGDVCACDRSCTEEDLEGQAIHLTCNRDRCVLVVTVKGSDTAVQCEYRSNLKVSLAVGSEGLTIQPHQTVLAALVVKGGKGFNHPVRLTTSAKLLAATGLKAGAEVIQNPTNSVDPFHVHNPTDQIIELPPNTLVASGDLLVISATDAFGRSYLLEP